MVAELYLEEWTIELIDTLWNVNPTNLALSCSLGGELIDTLWNVNSNTGTGSLSPLRN